MRIFRTSSTHNYKSSESGAAAVEFGLIAPVLFLLIFGIIQFGQFYSKYNVFQGAAREGARVAAVRADLTTVQARVVNAAEPYSLQTANGSKVTMAVAGGVAGQNGESANTCHSNNIGKAVTVSWIQPIQIIQMPFMPKRAFLKNMTFKGVFNCE